MTIVGIDVFIAGLIIAFFTGGAFGLMTISILAAGKRDEERSEKMLQFLRLLKEKKHLLTPQQYRTIRGQALAGNIDGAKKELNKILDWRPADD